MRNHQLRTVTLVLLALATAYAIPAQARGDKVIPQVADGPGIVTKFDLINISDAQAITKFKLRFFRQDGTAWNIATSLGVGSEFTLNLGSRQTLRVETLGQSSPTTAGYAVIRDDETLNSQWAKDLVLGITTYYAISAGGSLSGVVSVPVGDPTEIFSLPVEMNNDKGIYTGFAIVNLAGVSNNVSLKLYAATTPSSGSVGSTPTAAQTITLQPNEQRAKFLHEQGLFPGTLNFKGLLEGITSSGPVAILGLVQLSTPSSVQYASIAPTLRDYLRQNTNMLLIQPESEDTKKYWPLDLDLIRVDYFIQDDGDEGLPWDIKYETLSRTGRQLTPVNGAGVASLGLMDPAAFDAYSLASLRGLQYNTTPIDLSDGSANLAWSYAFAVRTNLGNYAKIHIVRIIDTTVNGIKYQDLGLEITVFK